MLRFGPLGVSPGPCLAVSMLTVNEGGGSTLTVTFWGSMTVIDAKIFSLVGHAIAAYEK